MLLLPASKPDYAELVEALFLYLRKCTLAPRKEQPFDKLRVNGFW